MRRTLAVASAAVLVAVLAGCFPSTPPAPPTPEPTFTPLFASDEEALAAAEAAYREYLAVSDAILQAGGVSPERIDAVATPAVAESEKSGFKEFRESGFRSVGATTFRGMVLQRYDAFSPDGIEIVKVYVCSDASAVDVLGPGGNSVVGPDRQVLTPFELGFDVRQDKSGLILAAKDVWTGDGVC